MRERTSEVAQSGAYRSQTLWPLNSVVFIMPMLVAFHAAAALYGTNLLAPGHIRKVLEFFGTTGSYLLPAALVIAVLLSQHALSKLPWRLEPKVLAGMFAESIIWMVPLIVMFQLTGRLQAGNGSFSLGPEIFQAFGAAIYEEFLFRLVLISILLLIFVDVIGLKKEPVAVVAVILAGVAFSLYHLSASELSGASPFPWRTATYRTVAGIYLGSLFLFRGFGIGVGAHAFYNLYAHIASP